MYHNHNQQQQQQSCILKNVFEPLMKYESK